MNYYMEVEATDEKGFIRVKIKFNTGASYIVSVVDPAYVNSKVGSLFGAPLALPGLIVMKSATLEEVRKHLKRIVESGYFDHLVPDEGGGE